MKIEVLPKLISETIRDVKKTLLHFLVSVILVLLFETADCARLLSELGHIKTTDRNRLHDILKWSLADLRRKSTWKGIDSHSKTCRKTCWPMEQGLDWQNSLVPSSRYVHRMTFSIFKTVFSIWEAELIQIWKNPEFWKTKKKTLLSVETKFEIWIIPLVSSCVEIFDYGSGKFLLYAFHVRRCF